MARERLDWTDYLAPVLYGGFVSGMFGLLAARWAWPASEAWAAGAAAGVGALLVWRALRRQ